MNDLEREFQNLKNRLRQEEKKAKDIERAKGNEEGFAPKVTTKEVVMRSLACGNCGATFFYGEENSIWYLKEDNLPNFCSCCGGKIKKGVVDNG